MLRAMVALFALAQAGVATALYLGALPHSRFYMWEVPILAGWLVAASAEFWRYWSPKRRAYRALKHRHEARSAELSRMINRERSL